MALLARSKSKSNQRFCTRISISIYCGEHLQRKSLEHIFVMKRLKEQKSYGIRKTQLTPKLIHLSIFNLSIYAFQTVWERYLILEYP
jgi:hypothetical protein